MFLLFLVAALAEPPSSGLHQPPPEAVQEALEASASASMAERIRALTEPLLGTVYIDDPLGEQQAPDDDPLVRYDAFDCLTFVEEVVALSLAHDVDELGGLRQTLRYGDAPASYADRHHFMELQWIPNAVDHGLLVDTTSEYGETVHLEKTVDAALWHAWSGRERFAMTDAELPTGTMSLDVLPLDQAIANHRSFRPGSIMMIVRKDKPGVPIWITHLGFVLEGGVFRHASRMASSMRVRDHNLGWYLGYLATWESWPVMGVVLYEMPGGTSPTR